MPLLIYECLCRDIFLVISIVSNMKAELKVLIDRIVSQPNLSAEETDSLMCEAFSLAQTDVERKEAGEYLRKAIGKRKRPDIDVKALLGNATEFLNLSYIAKRYFNKDRTWLYQRLNHSIVNGKRASFSEAELKILSDSLSEIGQIIQQTSFNLTH